MNIIKLINTVMNSESSDINNQQDVSIQQEEVNDIVRTTELLAPPKEKLSKYNGIKKKKQNSFNGLTPKEWASLSRNVWNDLSSPRNQYQLEHGAVYPVKLVERLITIYSGEGDYVFDPFLGIGTTLIAAQNLKRSGIGIELNPRFYSLANKWVNENRISFHAGFSYEIIQGDCRKVIKNIPEEKVQLTVTSPPYADFIRKSVNDRKKTHKKSIIKIENNSTVKPYSEDARDFGNLPYVEFLKEIKEILSANFAITKKFGYSAWVVKDYRDTARKIPYVPFHSDLARVGEEVGFKYHDLIVWDQNEQRRLILLGYPSVFYANQNCSFIVVFRKT